MLAVSAIFQSYDQNILRDAVISCDVSPRATFDLVTLGFLRPDFRVVFDHDTLTLTFTLPGSRQGDILAIPMSNLVGSAGSPSSPRLTNAAGLDVLVPVPTATYGQSLPATLVVDLTDLESNDTIRTSNVWHLVIANSTDVSFGGAIAIYGPKTRLLDRDFQWEYHTRKKGGQIEVQNSHLTRFQQNFGTMEREIELTTLATVQDADAIEAWFDRNNGRGLPGLLWLRPEVQDAYLGIWQETFERINVLDVREGQELQQIRVVFTELSKGVAFL